jgi:prolipoprotein diacylglyceryltransferase
MNGANSHTNGPQASTNVVERIVTIPFPHISPVAIAFGPLELRWYGLMYAAGYTLGYFLARRRIDSRRSPLTLSALDSLIGYLVVGINAELYGRPSTLPWAMIFPTDPAAVPRHPSQLYEALGEGVLLAGLLSLIDGIARRHGVYRPGLDIALFLIGYGVIRFLIEFTRQPDSQLGLVLGPFSMGQLLCALMTIIGIGLLVVVRSSSPPRLTV